MAAPHSQREIRERRERILLLMAKGYNQGDIARELNTTRQTIVRDMKAINEMTNHGLYDLAKATLSTMYYSCIESLNLLQKECWKIYNNENNDPTITNWHRTAALRLAKDCNESKFNMFTYAPAMMQIERLHKEVEQLKRDTFDEKGNQRYLPYRDL